MKKITLKSCEKMYANRGQQAEYVARYTLTGRKSYADNKAATACADVGDIQIKSERATVCKGLDLQAHVAKDKAKRYGYVTSDLKTMYVMSPAEYIAFVEMFKTVDHDSTGVRARISTRTTGGNGGSNGGAVKIRIKHESKAMLKYLEEHTKG